MEPLNTTTTEIILDSISDGVFTVDLEWKIMSFNRAAEEITGIPRDQAIGRHCWSVFRSNMCQGECALKRTMKQGRSFIHSATHIVIGSGKQIPITVSTALLKGSDGTILGGVETFRDHSLVEELRKEISGSYRMGDIISASASMRKLFAILPQVSESDSTVLIEGETGTGKELMARAIHNLSPRRDNPFTAINCGALPDTLLESELFGYKAGAFTNAVKDKPGLFALARGGTLFLDEIGDTSPAFQARLLRVLEEREFQPLGAVKKETADVRVIAASNRDLTTLVGRDEFRQDLFYRINVVRLRLPTLKQRMEDIPLLIDHFIQRLNWIRGKSIPGVEHQALAMIMSHDFPGNIRELENIIEHAFVLCPEGHIRPEHLPGFLARETRPDMALSFRDDPVKSAEIQLILSTLKKNNYNRKASARDLGIHKSTLFRKIDRLGIPLPAIDGRSTRT
ncbi:MAG: sigma 54-interacting transcriptional regulator [Pseudomonadota bacterium]